MARRLVGMGMSDKEVTWDNWATVLFFTVSARAAWTWGSSIRLRTRHWALSDFLRNPPPSNPVPLEITGRSVRLLLWGKAGAEILTLLVVDTILLRVPGIGTSPREFIWANSAGDLDAAKARRQFNSSVSASTLTLVISFWPLLINVLFSKAVSLLDRWILAVLPSPVTVLPLKMLPIFKRHGTSPVLSDFAEAMDIFRCFWDTILRSEGERKDLTLLGMGKSPMEWNSASWAGVFVLTNSFLRLTSSSSAMTRLLVTMFCCPPHPERGKVPENWLSLLSSAWWPCSRLFLSSSGNDTLRIDGSLNFGKGMSSGWFIWLSCAGVFLWIMNSLAFCTSASSVRVLTVNCWVNDFWKFEFM